MRRHVVLRVALVLGAVALAAAAWLYGDVSPAEGAEGFSRSNGLLALLVLGIFSLAAYGFDLRDWF